jgi:hypothetical protein
MIGNLVLTLPMLAILAYGLLEVKRSRTVGVAISLLTLAALSFIWIPQGASAVAGALQLGSARDLVLYSWIGLVTLILLNLHLRIRQQMQLVAALTRRVAIAGRQPPDNQPEPAPFQT